MIHGRLILACVALAGGSLCAQELRSLLAGPHHGLAGSEKPPRVWMDEPGDGVLWVRGMDYKASFEDGAATFIPFLGSTAPRNFPVTFRLGAISVGGSPLPIDEAGFARHGDRIVAERGPAREVYEVRPHEVEQVFELDRPVGEGAVVVRIEIVTDLHAEETAAGIEFSNALGGVRYGRATAYDAGGRSAAVATELRQGAIELTVPAEFVSSATFPMTIDPVVLTFTASSMPGGGGQDLNVDVAHDYWLNRYLVVYEQIYSATDHDIYTRSFDFNGNPIPALDGWIDFTSAWWGAPKVANNRVANQFLVVAMKEVTIGGGFVTTEIWGRTLGQVAIPFTQGPQFQIGSAAFHAGPLTHPDVGGDPNPSPPTYYCVVYQVWSGLIEYRLVTGSSGFGTGWIALASGGKSNPSISKSNGANSASDQDWTIVFQHTYSATDEDIMAARIHWNGAITSPPFWVDTSAASDDNPCVSSVTNALPAGGYAWFVAYERTGASNDDLVGQVMSGASTLTGSVNLSALVGAPPGASQLTPSADSDGCRFALAYSESCGIFCFDALPYVTTLHLESGNTIGVTEGPSLLNGYAGPDLLPRVTSTRSSGGAPTRYLIGFHTQSITSSDIYTGATLYDGHSSVVGPGSWFTYVVPGCGGLTLSLSGRPALGETVLAGLTGVQGISIFLFGPALSPAAALCPSCTLLVNPLTATAVAGPLLSGTIPCEGALVGAQVAIQGVDIGVAGGCAGSPSFTLSEGVIITIL